MELAESPRKCGGGEGRKEATAARESGGASHGLNLEESDSEGAIGEQD